MVTNVVNSELVQNAAKKVAEVDYSKLAKDTSGMVTNVVNSELVQNAGKKVKDAVNSVKEVEYSKLFQIQNWT